ncbi:MAG: hypothetical protein WCO09_01975, partial [bacterium]
NSAAEIIFKVLKDSGMKDLPSHLIGQEVSSEAVAGFKFRSDRTVYVPLKSYQFKSGDLVEVK